jgi:SAM-dependent methyltransferase
VSGCAAPAVEHVSEVRENPFPDQWYRLTGPDHFWFQWRLTAAVGQIRDVGIPTARALKALEVGCGTGVLRDQLEAVTAWDVDMTDLHLDALRCARRGRGRVLYYDILEQRAGFVAAYDVVILFDVLEHIDATQPFLDAVLNHVKPGGFLLVNVPALGSLFSAYDRAAGHLRRYDRLALAAELAPSRLEIRDMRYWGLSLVPLLALRKLLLSRVGSTDTVIRTGFRPPGQVAHALLKGVMRIETLLAGGGTPMGSSLLLAGRKPEH